MENWTDAEQETINNLYNRLQDGTLTKDEAHAIWDSMPDRYATHLWYKLMLVIGAWRADWVDEFIKEVQR
jgi:hypothetical protein